MKKILNKKFLSMALVLSLLVLSLAGCSGGSDKSDDSATKDGNKNIVFADAGWDSIKFHNAVAGTVAEEVFGYTWEEIPGSTPVVHEGTITGEIDVHMEEWTDNIPSYTKDLEAGKLKELGVNFDDNYQGFYVPKYVIEGDPERDIEAMAPDLKTVEDLKKYADIFPDEENPGRGRVYGAIPGWEVDTIMNNKYMYYGLDETFEYFRPGSEAALGSALSGAYEKGEAVVGYYWEPTWLMGKYDFVLLEDAPYDKDTYLDGETALPPVKVTIAVSNDFADGDNEDFIDFLSNYSTSSQLTSDALAYMQDNDANYIEAARWFIEEHIDLIGDWLSEEDLNTLKDSMDI